MNQLFKQLDSFFFLKTQTMLQVHTQFKSKKEYANNVEAMDVDHLWLRLWSHGIRSATQILQKSTTFYQNDDKHFTFSQIICIYRTYFKHF